MKKMTMCLTLAICAVAILGCGKKADETKPISEVKAEAEKMDVAKLKAMAGSYKDAIMAKKVDVEKIAAKLKDIPLTNMLSEEAKSLKSEVDDLNKSLSALNERFKVYYNKLKEKGGDVSGLEIK